MARLTYTPSNQLKASFSERVKKIKLKKKKEEEEEKKTKN